MQDLTAMEKGWQFAAKLVGTDNSSQYVHKYVGEVAKAINQLEQNINNHAYRGQQVAQFKGYVAEEWAAGTFNVDAIAANSTDRAIVLHSNKNGSADIQLNSGKKYSCKVYDTGEKSAKAQATLDSETQRPVYDQQERFVPDDQLESAKAEAHRRGLSNQESRPNVAEAYKQTEKHLTSEVNNDEGIKSIKANKKDFEKMAKDGKKQKFNAEKYGLTTDSAIKPEYIMKKAIRAGFSAATVTIIMQTAPEIFKTISYLIKNGELDINQVEKVGTKAISSGTESFLNGAIAFTLHTLCEKGTFGVALKTVNATILGTVVALTLETVKNSILVAAGKMTPDRMGSVLVDHVVISTGYIIGAKIGGVIGQALGFELPVIGYVLGSLVGCAFAAIYNVGKKKFISFCVDTGFTCFGLVEQDYVLPEEVLYSMGIDCTPITRVDVVRTDVSRVEIDRITLSNGICKTSIDTIDIKVIKRGIIGVNKVGYVF